MPPLAALAAALAVTACSSTVGGSPVPPAGSAPGRPAGSPPAQHSTVPRGGFPTDLPTLAALIGKGNAAMSSAHLELTDSAAGTTVAGAGDEQLSGGKVRAIDLTETVGAITLRFVIVHGAVYAQLPAQVYPASKPWIELSATTLDARLHQLYTSFQAAAQTSASGSVRFLLTAGRSLRLLGTPTLDGTRVAQYAIAVDVAALPADFPNRAELEQSGLDIIPAVLYVDAQGRVRKVTEDLTVSGQRVTSEFTLTRIDRPVSISAPPAGQVERP